MKKDYGNVYSDTSEFIQYIIKDYDFYGQLVDMLSASPSVISLKKKQLIKQIDENWLNVIEQSLASLDARVRAPMRLLEEKEEVLPIELSRNINARSVRHLAQHTNLINSFDGETVTPSKILNVFRDETVETYENRFVYTLIERLYIFVERRYKKLCEYGADENSTAMDFETTVESLESETKIKFSMEVKNKDDFQNGESSAIKSSRWERLGRIRRILLDYMECDFVKQLSGKQIRPPVMRTNAIMKNKDLKTCLELWQFIESYDKLGYEIVVNETAEKPDENYINDLLSLLALQYVSFEYNLSGGIDKNAALAARPAEEPIVPRLVTDFEPFEADDFNVYDIQQQRYVSVDRLSGKKRLTPDEVKIRLALETAIAADKELIRLEKQRIKREAEEKLRREKEAQQRKIEKEKRKKIIAEEKKKAKAEKMRLEREANHKKRMLALQNMPETEKRAFRSAWSNRARGESRAAGSSKPGAGGTNSNEKDNSQ